MQTNEEKFGRAVESGDVDRMKNILLEAPSLDVNGTIEGEIDGECGDFPFILLAPDLATIRLLLDHGADPNASDNSYREAGSATRLLQKWCRENDEVGALAVMELLLQRGANPNLPEYGFRDVEFCLVIAVELRDIKKVTLLLKHGADPDIVCTNDNTLQHPEQNVPPLIRRLLSSPMDELDFRIAELLLENGAEAKTFKTFENDYEGEEESLTNFFLYKVPPLTKYDARAVKLLLKYGACPYAMFEDQSSGIVGLRQRWDPLQEALDKQQFKIASHLLKARGVELEALKAVIESRKPRKRKRRKTL